MGSSSGESVIVVMDANMGKGSLDALDWAIKYVVGPSDTVVILGVLPEIGRKTTPSCLPFHVGIGTSGIWVKLEFSGHGEMTPSELQEEIERKKKEYQRFLQPFYRHCMKRDVKLDIKLAAGYESKKIAVQEAQKLDPRWIVLDGHLKKDKQYIHHHVACHVALLKAEGVATLIPSNITGPDCQEWQIVCRKIDHFVKKPQTPPSPTPCFPRAFSHRELEEITNTYKFLVVKDQHKKIYRGILEDVPVMVVCFLAADDEAVSLLKIVSRVRHRNILNLVGYCCTRDSIFLVCDCPSVTLEACLLCEESARKLSWMNRWGVAMEIGAGVQYLHEEFVDGSIVNLSICSANVAIIGASSAMLSVYDTRAKQLKLDVDPLPAKCKEYLWADIKDYGVLLLELITGQSKRSFEEKDGKSLVDWALPFLEKKLLSVVLDSRLSRTTDPQVAHMARAALVCLKNGSTSMSKVMAVVRGDEA